MRPLRFQKSYLPHAEGSCLVSMGKTQVLCVATVEEGAPPHAEEKGNGWVTAEYAMLPRAGEKRSSRAKNSTGGRAQEISRLIGRSLRAGVNLSALAGHTITVDCDVIRADGGTRTASINGGFIALVEAIRHLYKLRKISRWPVRHFVGAVSVGIFKNRPVVDLSYIEDKDAEADINVVMNEKGGIIEVQGTAEGRPFSSQEFSSLMKRANGGIRRIITAQKKSLGALPAR